MAIEVYNYVEHTTGSCIQLYISFDMTMEYGEDEKWCIDRRLHHPSKMFTMAWPTLTKGGKGCQCG